MLKVPQELLVELVLQDHKDLKVLLEIEVIKEELHRKDLQVIEDLKVLWDTKEPLDYMDYKGQLDIQDPLELLDLLVQEGRKVLLDIQVEKVA